MCDAIPFYQLLQRQTKKIRSAIRTILKNYLENLYNNWWLMRFISKYKCIRKWRQIDQMYHQPSWFLHYIKQRCQDCWVVNIVSTTMICWLYVYRSNLSLKMCQEYSFYQQCTIHCSLIFIWHPRIHKLIFYISYKNNVSRKRW